MSGGVEPRGSAIEYKIGEPQVLKPVSVCRAAAPTSGLAAGLLASSVEADPGNHSFRPGPQCTWRVAALGTVRTGSVEHMT